ncbi:hypothetical protein CO674_36080 [Rhizobium hidalgonense]|uniref:Uncharacterized protein n=1 Tax=Rhizobium hidalgonense TaxID=1538159 RepID=A0ABX4JFV9_9HYPH|nr:hypothetical protein CO674_36080 [Rhizobium hidalgonense]PON09357.1 hypothetical protein ATY29_01220 [Rhizobium hidalgonense]
MPSDRPRLFAAIGAVAAPEFLASVIRKAKCPAEFAGHFVSGVFATGGRDMQKNDMVLKLFN